MRNTPVATVVALALLSPAFAQPRLLTDIERYRLAEDLAGLIGYEQFCSLEFDKNAVAAWVERRVPADDLRFNDTLSSSLYLQKQRQSDLSQAAKAAHCTQVARAARAVGFVR